MLDTPAERLRDAREGLGLSRAQLAAKIRKSESTVRAHENGQNAIQPDAAVEYANELGVTPAWILFGDASRPPARVSEALREVPVAGIIIPGIYVGDEAPKSSDASVTLPLPGYEDEELIAFEDRSQLDMGPSKSFVVCASPERVGLRLVDEVVIEFGRPDNLIMRDLAKVGGRKDGVLFYQGPSQSKANRLWYGKDATSRAGFRVRVVVARLWVRSPPDVEFDQLA